MKTADAPKLLPRRAHAGKAAGERDSGAAESGLAQGGCECCWRRWCGSLRLLIASARVCRSWARRLDGKEDAGLAEV